MFQFCSWLLLAIMLCSNIFAMYLVGPLPKEAPEIDEGPVYYDKEGYNEYGFDKYGRDRFGYDEYGFDHYGYDRDGFDEWGFDEQGFDQFGRSRFGYDEFGFDHYGYDRDGFDERGFDKYGFDQFGRDRQGFTTDDYFQDDENSDRSSEGNNNDDDDEDDDERNGQSFAIDEGDRTSNSKSDNENSDTDDENTLRYGWYGYDISGFDKWGFDRWGFDHRGFDSEGFDQEGFDENGYDYDGYDREGFNKNGLDRNGYKKEGVGKKRCNQEALTGSDSNEAPLPYDQKASGAKNHRLDRKFKQKNHKHFVSLYRAKKQAREVNTSRKLDRITVLLTKTQREYEQLFAIDTTTQTKSTTLDDGKAVFVGPSALSPEVIDGKWAHNRVDQKDRHMPPRSEKNQARQGNVYPSQNDVAHRFCKNILKNQAPPPIVDPANKSLQLHSRNHPDSDWRPLDSKNWW